MEHITHALTRWEKSNFPSLRTLHVYNVDRVVVLFQMLVSLAIRVRIRVRGIGDCETSDAHAQAQTKRRKVLGRFWDGFGKVLGRFWEGSGELLGGYVEVLERFGAVLARFWRGSDEVLGVSGDADCETKLIGSELRASWSSFHVVEILQVWQSQVVRTRCGGVPQCNESKVFSSLKKFGCTAPPESPGIALVYKGSSFGLYSVFRR